MMGRCFFALLTFLALDLSPGVLGDTAQRDTLYRKIYRAIGLRDYCVRLTNATHTIGCGTGDGGTTGTIHFVESEHDVNYVVSSGSHPPYVAAIGLDMFNSHVMRQFIAASHRVAGVLINGTRQHYSQNDDSPSLRCPNQNYGLYPQKSCSPVWNNNGSGLSFESIPFPVFVLGGEDLATVRQCYEAFNAPVNDTASYPLCKVNMQAFMYAAKDTPTCMRKENVILGTHSCDPLENPQVWGSLFNVTLRSLDEPSIVFLAAKMDTSAFFHQLAYGADNDATGMITLFAALEAMGKLKRNGQLGNGSSLQPIVFTFFNGEEWDYIGSSRMVYDMTGGRQFPNIGGHNEPYQNFGPGNINYFLELRQLGLASGGMFYGHRSMVNTPRHEASQMLFDAMQNHTKQSGLELIEVTENNNTQLPPASLQSFLKVSKSIAGLVVTDHEKEFANKFYGSVFDSGSYVGAPNRPDMSTELARNLTNVATAVARTALELAGAESDVVQKATADEATVSSLLYCFLYNSNCTYFRRLLDSDDQRNKLVPGVPLSRYISVDGSTPFVETIVNRLAVRMSGFLVDNDTACDDDGDYLQKKFTMQDSTNSDITQCWMAYVYEYTVKSPAFSEDNYGSHQYSTWAESVWDDPSARMFVVSSDYIENVTLGVGCLVLVVSFALVFLVTRRVEKVFSEQ